MKNLILLSTKSAGSSAIQKFLSHKFEIDLLPATPHHENETLFWTKAASVLGLHQDAMHRSVVPYSIPAAKTQLHRLLKDNQVSLELNRWNEEELFNAYLELARTVPGTFFEKSPHHLRNFSNLELMIRAAHFLKGKLDMHFIGLIRNPMDTIYSVWQRWRYHCPAFEREWYQSYRNLQDFASRFPDQVKIFRYEDLTTNIDPLKQHILKIGINPRENPAPFSLHSKSKSKWLKDKHFGHQLDEKTLALASSFGYSKAALINPNSSPGWVWRSNYHLAKYEVKAGLKKGLGRFIEV